MGVASEWADACIAQPAHALTPTYVKYVLATEGGFWWYSMVHVTETAPQAAMHHITFFMYYMESCESHAPIQSPLSAPSQSSTPGLSQYLYFVTSRTLLHQYLILSTNTNLYFPYYLL